MSTRWLGAVVALALPAAILGSLADHLGQVYNGETPQPVPALVGMTICVSTAGLALLDAAPIPLAAAVATTGIVSIAAQLSYAIGSDPRLPLDAGCQALPLFCLAITAVLLHRARREGSRLRGVAVAPLVPLWCTQVVLHASMDHTRDGGGPLLGVIAPIGWVLVPWLSIALLMDVLWPISRWRSGRRGPTPAHRRPGPRTP